MLWFVSLLASKEAVGWNHDSGNCCDSFSGTPFSGIPATSLYSKSYSSGIDGGTGVILDAVLVFLNFGMSPLQLLSLVFW
jgi:hypothetical protein